MKELIRDAIIQLLMYMAIGACIALGMKAIDWLVPDKPKTIQLDVRNVEADR